MKRLLACLFFLTLSAFSQASHQVNLTWTAPSDSGVTYNVYRGVGTCASNPTFSKLNTTPLTGASYIDFAVTAGNTYCYAVTSVFGGVESVQSNKFQAAIAPFPPTNLAGTIQ